MRTRWAKAPFSISTDTGEDLITVSGRDRWALECLMVNGPKGVTPISTPGPRWSAYVFNLRALGVDIETVHEAHKGSFPGSHARYVLRSTVTRRTAEGA